MEHLQLSHQVGFKEWCFPRGAAVKVAAEFARGALLRRKDGSKHGRQSGREGAKEEKGRIEEMRCKGEEGRG